MNNIAHKQQSAGGPGWTGGSQTPAEVAELRRRLEQQEMENTRLRQQLGLFLCEHKLVNVYSVVHDIERMHEQE